MKAFSVLFEEQESPVIEYNGKTVYRFLNCTTAGTYNFKFRNVSTNSKRGQYIDFHIDMVGEIYINDIWTPIPKRKFPQIVLKCDKLTEDFSLKIILKGGDFGLCNADNDGDEEDIYVDSLIFGLAMTIDRLEDGWFRLNCNDRENDDDFDDLVFEMKVENENSIVDIIEEWKPKYPEQ